MSNANAANITALKTATSKAVSVADGLVAGSVTQAEITAAQAAVCSGLDPAYALVVDPVTPDPPPNPPSGMAPPTALPAGYKLIFDDQFAGPALDATKWITEYGTAGIIWNNKGALPAGYSGMNMPGANQQAVMHASQLTVNNGLTITAEKNTSGVAESDYPWISGVINTMGKFTLPTTGWFGQVKVRMPDATTGCWAAIWSLPGLTNNSQNELDGFEGGFDELKGVPANRTIHYDYFANTGQEANEFDVGVDMSLGYHIYGVQWVPGSVGVGSVRYYFDNVLERTVDNVVVTAQAYEIQINLQIAAGVASSYHTVPVAGQFPTHTMEVAEVQVYA